MGIVVNFPQPDTIRLQAIPQFTEREIALWTEVKNGPCGGRYPTQESLKNLPHPVLVERESDFGRTIGKVLKEEFYILCTANPRGALLQVPHNITPIVVYLPEDQDHTRTCRTHVERSSLGTRRRELAQNLIHAFFSRSGINQIQLITNSADPKPTRVQKRDLAPTLN